MKKHLFQPTHTLRNTALVLLAALTVTGCSKNDPGGGKNDGTVPITLGAGVGNAVPSRAGDGPIEGGANITPALTLWFARTDLDVATGIYGAYGATAIESSRAEAAGNAPTAITWVAGQEQYYPAGDKKTKFTGWYPGGAAAANDADGKGYYDGTAKTVSWTFDGTQDVMTAASKEGSAAYDDAIGNFTFEHRLSQVQVYIYAESAAAQAAWGKVQQAAVLSQRTECSYNLAADDATGTIVFSGTADTDFSVYDGAVEGEQEVPIGKTNAKLLGTSMIEPQAAGYGLEVQVTTASGTAQYLTFTRAYDASTSYALYIKLTAAEILPDGADIVPWSAGDDADGGMEIPITSMQVDQNGILTVNGKMLFFQFGSVVGFTQEGDWSADKVLFNPVTGSPDYATYSNIPCYTADDWGANRRNISAATYHNGTNVKAGKGDPCKLAGLTAAEIQSMTAAQLDAYSSGWCLPTNEEQCTFTGQIEVVMYSTHWTASDSRYDGGGYYSGGSAGGYFPMGKESETKNYLPAAGLRRAKVKPTDKDGFTEDVGTGGYYWSNEAYSDRSGHNLAFGPELVSPRNLYSFATGYGVRCVKAEVLPEVGAVLMVDSSGELNVDGDGKMLFFKFGGVVGFTQEGDWSADKVLFDPVTGSSGYASYDSIPVYTLADWDDKLKNVSDPLYHKGTNVKAGKGDPCKLVGLTAARIQSMTDTEIDAYNSGWRLPTSAENLSFTGGQIAGVYEAHWTPSDFQYHGLYYSTGSAGGYFPMGKESETKNYLPAAGHRSSIGSSGNVGSQGYYWSGETQNDVYGYYLNFSNSHVGPLNYLYYTNGFGARCVKQ